ncbi:helix-turn-helix domain-containing protein [Sinorhizobium meliloti]|uniref:helix-turn-helix domain-containing protein n=1 Tax=Rhizobium meliloti TaxID=382 RepID=UPI0004825251|nr:helix-turn-helix domain-containing protein [Sinorhizobium meliloti]MDE4620643.1 helix-turn-helix domain-containing protein [Sinorhizobium meliloti]
MKTHFIPMPVRALQDDKLSAVDLRVLGAVAYHDRLGKNGRGCFASQATLAAMARCDIRSVKRSLQNLGKPGGYIVIEKSKQDARQRVYRIVYEIGDKADTYSETDRGQTDAKIGDKLEKNHQRGQGPKGGKHNSKHILLNAEANAGEPAPLSWRNDLEDGKSENVGGILAMLERALKLGAEIPRKDLEGWYEYLEHIMETNECGDPNYGRAYRLSVEIDDRLPF